jgi:hypothetical protein
MPDTVRVTTRQSLPSRIGGALIGLVVGLVLFVAAFPLLWWNEGRAVHRARSLAEGASIVQDVPADAVGPANEAKLVHVTGLATTDQRLTDDAFGVSATALRLARIAETYQWREESKSEKRKKFGGSEETVTTYHYSKTWSSGHHDSSSFHEPAGHENPPSLAWESQALTADRVTCGAFTLGPEIVSKIGRSERLSIEEADSQALQAAGFRVAQGTFYKGPDPASPAVGDVRVRFEVTNPQTVSLVAQQRGSGFAAYRAKAGSTILLVEEGEVPAEEMFAAARKANTITTWLVRLGGFLAMFLGLALVLRPISVIGSIVPFIGSVLGAGIGLLSFTGAAVLSLVTIAFAWLAYRPLIGGFLLALAAGCVVLTIRSRRPTVVVPPPIPT